MLSAKLGPPRDRVGELGESYRLYIVLKTGLVLHIFDSSCVSFFLSFFLFRGQHRFLKTNATVLRVYRIFARSTNGIVYNAEDF